MDKPNVGDVLWLVPTSRHSKSREITVTKVGRKWAYYGEGWQRDRFDISTGCVDGGGCSSAGRVYASRDEHEKRIAAGEAWDRLRRLVDRQWHPPEGVDAERIEQAIALLEALRP